MASKQTTRRKNRLALNMYKVYHKCCICHSLEDLTFHHINPTSKTDNVSNMSNKSVHHAQLEINKCVVMCRKCHNQIEESGSRIKRDEEYGNDVSLTQMKKIINSLIGNSPAGIQTLCKTRVKPNDGGMK